jgi:hypothetical protein
MQIHRGSCHCGAIAFEVDGDIGGVETCNCSICIRTGFVHWYVEPERFRLVTPAATLATYVFGTFTAKNHFCRVCGIAPFRRARSDPHKVDVNVRCLEGVDLSAIATREFDGRNWEAALAARPPHQHEDPSAICAP